MSEETTVIESPPAEPDPLEEDLQHLILLRRQQHSLNEEIQQLITRLQETHLASKLAKALRPTWGPCTRCGNVWTGFWADQPPIGCPRCGSTGWRYEPRKHGARKPSDPPNPKWAKRRKGLPSARPARAAKEQGTSLVPPPKFEEITKDSISRDDMIAMRSGLSLVPPPQVRFAERRQEPDPMVASARRVDYDEPYSAPEGDGSMEVDDGHND